jgi:cytochrome P450
LVGGHLTTANTISWTLYELARHPYVQTRLRAEMLDARSKAQARGNVDVTANDFENMPYTIAVMKESLRLHPITVRINREATKDDVVPLYTPLVTRSGKVVKEIIIPKGTNVSLSIHGYNL